MRRLQVAVRAWAGQQGGSPEPLACRPTMEGVAALPAGVHALAAPPFVAGFAAAPATEQPLGVPGPPLPRRSRSSSLVRPGRIPPPAGPSPSSGASWRTQAAASVRTSATPFCRFSSWAVQHEAAAIFPS